MEMSTLKLNVESSDSASNQSSEIRNDEKPVFEDEQQGEKLYVTADKRSEKGGCRRPLCWTVVGLAAIAALVLIILAATGTLYSSTPTPVGNDSIVTSRALGAIGDLISPDHGNQGQAAKDETDQTDHGSSMNNTESSSEINHTDHGSEVARTDESEGRAHHGDDDILAQDEAIPTTVVDESMYVPRTIEGELKIENEEFTPALADGQSEEYKAMASAIERALREALTDNSFGMDDVTVTVTGMRQGSVVVSYRINWKSNQQSASEDVMTPDMFNGKLKDYFQANNYQLKAYKIAETDPATRRVVDLCKVNKNGCDHECIFDEKILQFTCVCPPGQILSLENLKECVTEASAAPEPEPTLEPQPASEPEPHPVSEVEPHPVSAVEPTSEPQPIAEPEPTSEPHAALEPEPEPATEPKSSSEPEPTSEPHAVSELQPSLEPLPVSEPSSQATSEPYPASEPQPSPEPRSEPEPTFEPQPTSEPSSEPHTTSETEAKLLPLPASEPEPAAEPEPSSVPEPSAEPQPSSKLQPISEPQPSSEPEPSSEPTPSAEPEPSSEPKPTAEPEPSSEPKPTVDPISEPQPSSEPQSFSEPQQSSDPVPTSEPQLSGAQSSEEPFSVEPLRASESSGQLSSENQHVTVSILPIVEQSSELQTTTEKLSTTSQSSESQAGANFMTSEIPLVINVSTSSLEAQTPSSSEQQLAVTSEYEQESEIRTNSEGRALFESAVEPDNATEMSSYSESEPSNSSVILSESLSENKTFENEEQNNEKATNTLETPKYLDETEHGFRITEISSHSSLSNAENEDNKKQSEFITTQSASSSISNSESIIEAGNMRNSSDTETILTASTISNIVSMSTTTDVALPAHTTDGNSGTSEIQNDRNDKMNQQTTAVINTNNGELLSDAHDEEAHLTVLPKTRAENASTDKLAVSSTETSIRNDDFMDMGSGDITGVANNEEHPRSAIPILDETEGDWLTESVPESNKTGTETGINDTETISKVRLVPETTTISQYIYSTVDRETKPAPVWENTEEVNHNHVTDIPVIVIQPENTSSQVSTLNNNNLNVTIYEVPNHEVNATYETTKPNTMLEEDHETDMNPFLPDVENNKVLVKKLQEGHDIEPANLNDTQNDTAEDHTQEPDKASSISSSTTGFPLTDNSTKVNEPTVVENNDHNLSTFLMDTDDLISAKDIATVPLVAPTEPNMINSDDESTTDHIEEDDTISAVQIDSVAKKDAHKFDKNNFEYSNDIQDSPKKTDRRTGEKLAADAVLNNEA